MVCMAHASLRQSDVSFTEAEISGRTLEIIDREVLRDIGIKSVGRQLEILQSLRADVWNYGELGVSREIWNFFIFCSSNLYSKAFSKITLKVSTAFYILRNWGKFENKACWPPSDGEIGGNNTFLTRSYGKTRRRLFMKHKHDINIL